MRVGLRGRWGCRSAIGSKTALRGSSFLSWLLQGEAFVRKAAGGKCLGFIIFCFVVGCSGFIALRVVLWVLSFLSGWVFGCNLKPVAVGCCPSEPDIMPALQRNRSGGSSKGYEAALDDESSSDSDPFVQNLFVLRHGEAGSEDDGEEAWDPPLTDRGKLQAWRVGRNLRMEDWNITRIVMSPLLRCVQTAAEVIAGLCSLPSSLEQQGSSTNAAAASNLALKASIECGLAEVMRRQGIARPQQVAHKNSLEPCTLDLHELYSLLPPEIYDTSYQPIRETLPSFRENAAEIQNRYTTTLQKIANRFHSENVLCITHGEGVMKAVSMMWPRVEIYGVAYCAYTHAQRPNFNCEEDSNVLTGEWEFLTESGSCSGIFYVPCS